MKYDCCQVSLNCSFGFWLRKVLQRDSLIAAFVIVHADSYGGQQEKSFNPFSASMTYWIRHTSYTLYDILMFSAHQDFEGRSQIIGTPNVNLAFGILVT